MSYSEASPDNVYPEHGQLTQISFHAKSEILLLMTMRADMSAGLASCLPSVFWGYMKGGFSTGSLHILLTVAVRANYPTQTTGLLPKSNTGFIYFRSAKVTSDKISQTSCHLTLQVIQFSTLHPKCESKQCSRFSRQLQSFPCPWSAQVRGSCWHLPTQGSTPYHPGTVFAVVQCHRAYWPIPEGTRSVTSLQNEILLSPANPLLSSFCSVCFSTFLYLLSTMWSFCTYLHYVVCYHLKRLFLCGQTFKNLHILIIICCLYWQLNTHW